MSTISFPSPLPAAPPLLVSEREAGRLLGVTARTVFELRRSGKLPVVKIRARVLYPVAAIHRFISEQAQTAEARQ
jgi:excisionase family DNA binding protein